MRTHLARECLDSQNGVVFLSIGGIVHAGIESLFELLASKVETNTMIEDERGTSLAASQ